MKVAVITRHAVVNYGSLLQAFATQNVIENMGHTCEIIDYIRKDESYLQREKTLLRQKPQWNKNKLKQTIYLALRQPESIAAGKRFEKEQADYLHLSKRYISPQQLLSNPPDADVYMTGSDQVWGPVENGSFDSSYCLSFAGDDVKKIAYAASFGRVDMSPETQQYYKKWLSRYDYISVREDSAKDILNKLEINAVQVLDPTLLLNSDFWSGYVKIVGNKKYVLVYQLHNDKYVGEYAKKVAKAMNLPLIRISTSFHQIIREGKFVWCPSVNEFLGYIKNAQCLITDSFHGTAFAINFNTPFVEVLPNNKTGTRNMSILKMTGLTDRILNNYDDISLAQRKIDYERVNLILENERKRSISVLKQMIEL